MSFWKISEDVLLFIANEATELRSEVDSVADYNAAQCGQNPSNSAQPSKICIFDHIWM